MEDTCGFDGCIRRAIPCKYAPNLKACLDHTVSMFRHSTDRCSATNCGDLTEWVGTNNINSLGRPIYLGLCGKHIAGEDMSRFSQNKVRDNTGKYCRMYGCNNIATLSVGGVKLFCPRHKYNHCDAPVLKRLKKKQKKSLLNRSQRSIIHQIKCSAELIYRLKITFMKN